jgi:hypothetical protein
MRRDKEKTKSRSSWAALLKRFGVDYDDSYIFQIRRGLAYAAPTQLGGLFGTVVSTIISLLAELFAASSFGRPANPGGIARPRARQPTTCRRVEISSNPWLLGIAAPGDGRTPVVSGCTRSSEIGCSLRHAHPPTRQLVPGGVSCFLRLPFARLRAAFLRSD